MRTSCAPFKVAPPFVGRALFSAFAVRAGARSGDQDGAGESGPGAGESLLCGTACVCVCTLLAPWGSGVSAAGVVACPEVLVLGREGSVLGVAVCSFLAPGSENGRPELAGI
ncbi:hypothetical protein NDU88_012210 [Pleurodeles waltl]|uniref:Secreted protein n=1 Tax=Pleurodeles waltl TaxID=8319 RepID=A0AAV7R285_PLEWA|nr:hypothetical protein NDU88_012210 [Pleurodeles waltl]